MSREQLFVVGTFVLVLLLNALVRVLRRRAAERAPREAGPSVPEVPGRTGTVSLSLATRLGEAGGIAPRAPRPLTAPPRTRRRPAVRVRSVQGARRAMVLMAVLGPCRGLEPSRPRRSRPPHA